MTIWVQRFPTTGSGPRLAVKDCIDLAGVPTGVGCEAITELAQPAAKDAPVVASARAQGARIVGKTNLNEVCWGPHGVNVWSGTPTNPLDETRIPGGSSSGSAVAVAIGEADVAYGTDTGGSVRIPAACCGIVGLKTTFGRIPVEGVRPLSVSLDTVGPLGADVAAVELGMRLLEPGFTTAPVRDTYRVARLRFGPDIEIDEQIDAKIDEVLRLTGAQIDEVTFPQWAEAYDAGNVVLGAEGYEQNRHLEDDPRTQPSTLRRMAKSRTITPADLKKARETGRRFRAALDGLLDRYDALALPTLPAPPPPVADPGAVRLTLLTIPVNLAGLPALAMPIYPASLQLIGSTEEELLALGRYVGSP